MAVLALDLASVSGWAVHQNGMDRPFFGTKQLKYPNEEHGIAGERLRVLIGGLHQTYRLTDIVFEAQHVGSGMSPQTALFLSGLGFMAEWIAYKIEARCFCVDIGTWRKHFIGKGNLAKDEARRRSFDKCHQLGWYPDSHDAAAACGVLDYYLSIMPKSIAHEQPWRDADFFARPDR